MSKNVLILHPEGWYIEECCVKPDNYTTAPTAALILSAYLRNQGYNPEVSLYSVGCSKIHYENEPDVLVVYSPWQRFCTVTEPVFKTFKAQRPNLVTVMVMYESLSNLEEQAMTYCPAIDYTVIPSEKEIAVGRIVEHGQTRKPEGFGERSGIIYRDSNGKPVSGGRSRFARDLTHLPYMGDELLRFLGRHPGHTYQAIAILLERGCPKTCNFCPQRTTRMRYRDPATAVAEARLAASVFGGSNVSTMTHEVLHRTGPLEEFADLLIEKDVQISWTIGTRSDLIDNEELLTKLRKAGVETLYFGIEAATEEGRRKLLKPISDEDIERSLEYTKQAGLGFHVALIMGFEWEDEAYLKQMKKFIRKMMALPHCRSIGLSRLIPFPGLPVEKEMVAAGLLPENTTLTDWNFRETELAWSFRRTSHMDRERQEAWHKELGRILDQHPILTTDMIGSGQLS